jgi:integrase/recombinase XerD
VPTCRRVRALLEHHVALRKEFPVGPRRAQGLVKVIANRAGVTRDITPHVFRHTFAAPALQKGIRLASVQRIPGHDRLAVYLNFTDNHIQEEFERKW